MATQTIVPLTQSLDLSIERVERGVPLSALETFVKKSGIPLKDLYDVVIPARTLKHRKARKERLDLDESDRLARVAAAFDFAARVFGTAERGRHWLTTPKHRFHEKTPLQMLRTGTGAELVSEMMGQIDEGMFA